MSNTPASRRSFLYQTSLATLGMLVCKNNLSAIPTSFPIRFRSLIRGVQLGVITYSYRSLPGHPDQILQYCLACNISGIELMGDGIEEMAGRPVNPVKFIPGQKMEPSTEQMQQLKAYKHLVASWRETVSMDDFISLHKVYATAGISIYAFKPNALNPDNTDGEILYALRAAKALGATSVTVELPADPAHSLRLGKFAEQERVYIGYHAHTQATDTAWDIALEQSPYNSINLDCGHYIAAGGNNTRESLLAFIEAKHDRITSMHIKDRKNKLNGGKNMPWGEGDTPLKEVLTLLRDKKYRIPATIELEYDIPAGSDAVKEACKCLDFAKGVLEG